MENWEELLAVLAERSFISVGFGLILLIVVGSGLWNARWKRVLWLFALCTWGAAFYFGLDRHEWGEVLFNGQLL